MYVNGEMTCMKTSVYCVMFCTIVLFACKKSSSGSTNTTMSGSWMLTQKVWSIGVSIHMDAPAADSSVSLELNSDGSYISRLNNNIVAQGAYTITTDTSYYKNKVLELTNFKTTGIFNLFPIVQLGTNGQVLSRFDGLFMRVSDRTLTLWSVITPGGSISYTFTMR